MTLASRWIRRVLFAGVGVLGLLAVLLAGALALPPSAPPEMLSVSQVRRSIDFSSIPEPRRFQARDGVSLAYRHYPALGAPAERIAVLVHGSAGSGRGAIHTLASALAARGVATFTPDIRGHGESGPRGDIHYIGQLEDDLDDLVREIRKTHPAAPITLIGHSAGGGFALRVAGSPLQALFERTVLLAPFLGIYSPSSRGDSGGWASPAIPRFIALSALNAVGLPCCQALPTLAFAVPAGSEGVLTTRYSYRLMRNFGSDFGYRTHLARATRPIAVFTGADDEMMWPQKYREAVGEDVPVTIVDGVDHMGIVANPKAVALIAEHVANQQARD